MVQPTKRVCTSNLVRGAAVLPSTEVLAKKLLGSAECTLLNDHTGL